MIRPGLKQLFLFLLMLTLLLFFCKALLGLLHCLPLLCQKLVHKVVAHPVESTNNAVLDLFVPADDGLLDLLISTNHIFCNFFIDLDKFLF